LLAALAWLEASALGEWVRGSGPWTYPLVNLTHLLGVALLLGSIVVLDLRLLGLWRAAPLAALARPTLSVAILGLCLALPSGLALLSAQASEYAVNPFLAVKLAAVGLGLVNVLALRRSAAWRALEQADADSAQRRRLALGGGLSLACWLAAVSAGRLIGYW
jgi:hypothetical protein